MWRKCWIILRYKFDAIESEFLSKDLIQSKNWELLIIALEKKGFDKSSKVLSGISWFFIFKSAIKSSNEINVSLLLIFRIRDLDFIVEITLKALAVKKIKNVFDGVSSVIFNKALAELYLKMPYLY